MITSERRARLGSVHPSGTRDMRSSAQRPSTARGKMALFAGVAAAVFLAVAPIASATPIRFSSAWRADSRTVYSVYTVYPYPGTRCSVNVWVYVFPVGSTRNVGGLGRNTIDGCADRGGSSGTYTVRIPAKTARGARYAVVVAAVNNDRNGRSVRHFARHFFRG